MEPHIDVRVRRQDIMSKKRKRNQSQKKQRIEKGGAHTEWKQS